MAYNNGYPINYPQFYPQNQTYQNQTYQQNLQNFPQNQQIQNGGFIPVPSEDVARNYPVAPGNSVTFKNENAPYVYTKTMGFSQLDRPIFEKYKLVREEDAQNVNNTAQTAMQNDETYNKAMDDVKEQIKALNEELENVKKRLHELEDVGA